MSVVGRVKSKIGNSTEEASIWQEGSLTPRAQLAWAMLGTGLTKRYRGEVRL